MWELIALYCIILFKTTIDYLVFFLSIGFPSMSHIHFACLATLQAVAYTNTVRQRWWCQNFCLNCFLRN